MPPVPSDGEPRLQHPLQYEEEVWSRGVGWIAGVDEVGRGPLAGPVVAAAVILPRDVVVEGADDSKRLSGIRREQVARRIREQALAISAGAASVREIDRDGIAPATARAMERALAGLDPSPGHVVVDGLPVSRLPMEHTAVVGGDGSVHCISCASIIAKVLRDSLMRRLAVRYPGYGWERNAGYGTEEHRRALASLGPSPHHRRSFAGVQLELSLSGGHLG
ncbi:MAG: ribonuclease HII [Gemmatimonadales bacterium]|nr:MAG: ribonuclease HII [Gemmatimonadales bacterium]